MSRERVYAEFERGLAAGSAGAGTLDVLEDCAVQLEAVERDRGGGEPAAGLAELTGLGDAVTSLASLPAVMRAAGCAMRRVDLVL